MCRFLSRSDEILGCRHSRPLAEDGSPIGQYRIMVKNFVFSLLLPVNGSRRWLPISLERPLPKSYFRLAAIMMPATPIVRIANPLGSGTVDACVIVNWVKFVSE